MENSNKAGRPKGRPNNLQKAAKLDLAEVIKREMEQLRKHLVSGVPFDKRAKLLLDFAKLILRKDLPYTKAAEEIREIICEALKPEFRKMFAYDKHQTDGKWQKFLLEALKLLATEQQQDILKKG